MITKTQENALKWLKEHTGDGLFDKNGVLVAGGEPAPFMRSTWNALEEAGKVKMYGGKKGRARCQIV